MSSGAGARQGKGLATGVPDALLVGGTVSVLLLWVSAPLPCRLLLVVRLLSLVVLLVRTVRLLPATQPLLPATCRAATEA